MKHGWFSLKSTQISVGKNLMSVQLHESQHWFCFCELALQQNYYLLNVFYIYECYHSSRYGQITNSWYDSGHLDLLLLVGTVLHLIRGDASGQVIFFWFSDHDGVELLSFMVFNAKTMLVRRHTSRWNQTTYRCINACTNIGDTHQESMTLPFIPSSAPLNTPEV